jgi:hypothetical protein
VKALTVLAIAGLVLGGWYLAVGAAKAAPPAAAAGARFVDVTAASGVRWIHENGAFGQRWLPETLGPGVVVLDANHDGLPDLLFVNGRNFPGKPGKAATPALYLNLGGMRFRDATHEAGLDFSAYCLGGAAADIDNDGWPDVYLSCLGQDHLLHNVGGRFVDISRQAGLSREYGLGASVAFFDADNDGFVDIFATRYVTWTPESDRFCSSEGRTKSYCTPQIYPGAASRYYHNRGDLTFEDATRAAGLWNPDAKSLGVLPVDVNGDGWTDLAVACDTHPNLLYQNLGDGTFEEVAAVASFATSGTGRTRGGMGIDGADYTHERRPSLVVTNFLNEMVGLYRNRGELFFVDVAPQSEVGRNTLLDTGWGTFFFDYDLDGWLDLFIANGPLDPRLGPPQPQRLFRNRGNGELAEVTATAGGDLARALVARGAAFTDLDGDGALDIALTTNAGPAKIFANRGPHGNWLRVHLEGRTSNRDGLGAQVEATAGGVTQIWQVHSGGSYLSQSEIDPTFGLGAARSVSKLVVRWPSGATQTLTAIPAGQRLTVVEPPGPARKVSQRRPMAPAAARP